MRLTIFALIVLSLIAVSVAASNKKAPQLKCSKNCGDSNDNDIICAKAKNGNKERLLAFGNECVLANYNCAHEDDPFEMTSRSACGPNVSVRLS